MDGDPPLASLANHKNEIFFLNMNIIPFISDFIELYPKKCQ